MSTGQKIKMIRESKNMSQKELGELLNKSQGTIAKYENDTAEMDYATLNAFCKFADCSTDYLLNDCSVESAKNSLHLFGERLRYLRREKKLTQKQLGDVIGINHHSITSYEMGKSEPSYNVLVKLADFYHCSTDYLLGRVDYPYLEIKKAPPESGAEEYTKNIDAPDLTIDEIRELRKFLQERNK